MLQAGEEGCDATNKTGICQGEPAGQLGGLQSKPGFRQHLTPEVLASRLACL